MYSFVQPNTAIILVLASIFLLASERVWKKIAVALGVFLLAGVLGVATLRGAINDPLFPAFSGLFAASGILLSFTSTQAIPKQASGKTALDFLPFVALGIIFGMLSDLLPGIAAPAQIAVFASAMLATTEARKFLALVSSIAASHCVFAFASLVSIGKAREGALAILNEIKPVLPSDLPILVGTFLLAVGVSAFLLMKLSQKVDVLQKLDVGKINMGVLAYLTCAVGIISGGEGLLLFATATAIGVLPPLLGIRRTHVMGIIIVPSIMLALGF
jgi:putative membrane protein